MRLRRINTVEEANAYLPEFTADYNTRFGKDPISPVDAHRSLLAHEELQNIFCWKEERTVTYNLTVQYDKRLYLIEDSLQNRKLRRKRITVYDYEDGNVALYDGNRKLNSRLYFDRIARVDSGAIVNNKRLGPLLEIIKSEQEKNPIALRSQRAPSRSHIGIPHAAVLKRHQKKTRTV